MAGMQILGALDLGEPPPGHLGILYAEDFDLSEPPPSSAAEPEPSFTQAELARAESLARTEAVEAARTEWEVSDLHLRTQALAAIAGALAEARDGANRVSLAAAERSTAIILSMVAALLPARCQAHGEPEIRSVLAQLLPGLLEQPRVSIRVHEAVLPAIHQDLQRLAGEHGSAFVVTSSPDLAMGDVRVIWTDGALIRDSAALAAGVRAALDSLGLLDPTHAERECRYEPSRPEPRPVRDHSPPVGADLLQRALAEPRQTEVLPPPASNAPALNAPASTPATQSHRSLAHAEPG